jgi:putative membrane protein
MNAVAQLSALASALVYLCAGVLESFFFHRPGVHRDIFHTPTEALATLRLWNFCQGFYNMFLAGGAVAGVIALHSGHEAAGRALVLYTCSFMLAMGIVLGVANRKHLDGALSSGILPLIALVAAPF